MDTRCTRCGGELNTAGNCPNLVCQDQRATFTTQCDQPPFKTCLVKGCGNRSDQGAFIGALCLPCANMLASGKVGDTASFLGRLAAEKELLERKVVDLEVQVCTLQSDLQVVSQVRDIERQHLDQSRAETKEYKDYCNAIFELARSFLPLCPSKSRSMWEIALERGRQMAAEGRWNLLAQRDAEWAEALAQVTGSHSMSPETAAARVEIAIQNAKRNLMAEIQSELASKVHRGPE